MATKKSNKYPKYTKKELSDIVADRKYWEAYGELIGAKLTGFTYKNSAQFIVEYPCNPSASPKYHSFSLDSYHCKMIDAAITKTFEFMYEKVFPTLPLTLIKNRKKK